MPSEHGTPTGAAGGCLPAGYRCVMATVPLPAADLDTAASFIAGLQSNPCDHVAYLSLDATAIRAELAALAGEQLAAGAMLVDGDAIRGLLVAEWHTEPPRAWWHGPFTVLDPWQAAAHELYDTVRRSLPPHVTQEELAGDAAHTELAAFAAAHGFTRARASVVCRIEDLATTAVGDDANIAIDPVAGSVPATVARLHDRCFPHAHRVGANLLGDQGIVLVARRGAHVVGYARIESQPSGDGYLDFVAVDSDSRGQGIAGHLVRAACLRTAAAGGQSLDLTVNEDNTAARSLYRRLGFIEQRILVPYRKEWSLSG